VSERQASHAARHLANLAGGAAVYSWIWSGGVHGGCCPAEVRVCIFFLRFAWYCRRRQRLRRDEVVREPLVLKVSFSSVSPFFLLLFFLFLRNTGVVANWLLLFGAFFGWHSVRQIEAEDALI
jgi:hypothetical protein